MTRAESIAWGDRYMITSINGRVWSRAMIRRSVLTWSTRSVLPYDDQDVDAILDNDEFMRRRAGEIPTRVCEAISDAAHDRWRDRR